MKEILSLLLILFNIVGYSQNRTDSIDSDYHIFIEGKYHHVKVKVFADDSLCFSGNINNEHPDIIELAEIIDIRFRPKKIEVVINHKVLNFNCNPDKPYLFISKKGFRKYKLSDAIKGRLYR